MRSIRIFMMRPLVEAIGMRKNRRSSGIRAEGDNSSASYMY